MSSSPSLTPQAHPASRPRREEGDVALGDSVVVVGGGVSGMRVSRRLAERGAHVQLLEASEHWGGRVETRDLAGFKAEFGAMRFQVGAQPAVQALCRELGVVLSDFPAFSAEPFRESDDRLPLHERTIDGTNMTSLQLLKRGVFALFGRDSENPLDLEWVRSLSDADFVALRMHAELRGTPLWKGGFWNALAHVLSPQAMTLIRERGTFFHLISDNPNAVEWAIFWLRHFQLHEDESLVTVAAGVATIIEKMAYELENRAWAGRVAIHLSQEVVEIRHGKDPASVGLLVKDRSHPGETYYIEADHVVLALPKSAVIKLSKNFPPEIRHDLHSVQGFPLVKAFIVTSKPWWRGDTPPQTNAHVIPTRELHYFFRPEDGMGMALLYTDRPASEYWGYFLTNSPHDRAEIERNERLKKALGGYLLSNPPDNDMSLANLESVVTYGIRDWSEEPFGGGCHLWVPGAESWEVRRRLAAFGLLGREDLKNIHVCGEAYSDYQGTIEGALRSVDPVLESFAPPRVMVGAR